MKKFFSVAALLVAGSSASAAEIKNIITDSVQLTVEGPAIQSVRMGASYSASGSNVSSSAFGGVGGAGTYTITNDGQAFSFSESLTTADTVVTSQSSLSSNGRFDSPNLYSDTITSVGGSAGTLAGSLSATGIPSVTAGGPGTTATGQRSVELSVFK
jgi:hypothetical protein